MKIQVPPTPNVLVDMVEEAKKRLQDRAQELNDQREALHMSRVFWVEIQSMTETPGWANYVEMAAKEIEKLRNVLEQPAEEHVTAAIRGSLKYLRQLPELSSLVAATLHALDGQEEMLSANLEEFVESGA